ncbi:MAG: EcsC family protein [Gemmobacter sp.]|uniref:EcsC family protein n=1 Tax=Gemmobacter sp. TaxID=1898957 RepID=UPI00391CFF2C
MTLPALAAPFPQAEIAALAERAARAGGRRMALLNRLGGTVESRLKLLPEPVRAQVLAVTSAALARACGLAAHSTRLGRLGGRGHMALAGVTGAAGGLGGLATAAAELPVTITLILRAIHEVAADHGFDPARPEVQREGLRVFASGSPLAADDGVDTAFIGARLTLTGPALHSMIATVAPKLATALGQKLAAQTVPVLGAVAGAGLNLTFVDYYRDLAEVRFGLLRLAQAHDPQRVARAFARAAGAGRLTAR